jgi:hypothetical protein
VGKQTFFTVRKNENPQILQLIKQLQSAKFLGVQVANRKLQTANLQISTKYCATLSQNSLNIRHCKRFLSTKLKNIIICHTSREKKYVLEEVSPQLTKDLGSANPQSATFAEGPQIEPIF